LSCAEARRSPSRGGRVADYADQSGFAADYASADTSNRNHNHDHKTANNWLSGTLSAALGKLTKLRQLELGTNFLYGTIGDWIGGLTQLENLNLGANAGANAADEDGEEVAGFVGTLPNSISRLTKLKELDLQVGSCPTVAGTSRVLGVHVGWWEKCRVGQLTAFSGLDTQRIPSLLAPLPPK